MRSALHITNGDSAAGTMKVAGLEGDIMPWRDVLHDGPVPAGLSLPELSRVRASYLSSEWLGEADEIAREFAARDTMLEKFAEYDRVVLWFEWDLYDQLQLIQLLEFFAGRFDEDDGQSRPKLEIVSPAGYLGNLPPENFPELHEQRLDVSREMLSVGQRAWRAFTSPDPRELAGISVPERAGLPFLDAALRRLLEELPWLRSGVARSERQLLEGIANGARSFGDVFKFAASREERIYCGDASAMTYLRRLSRGSNPLVEVRSENGLEASRHDSDPAAFLAAELRLTDTGKSVLSGESDWIELGGSDRWLGGVHLEGSNAAWRWDPVSASVIERQVH